MDYSVCDIEQLNCITDQLERIEERAGELIRDGRTICIAIDGRCGSGKTTVAELLAKRLNATLFHMDDFFLRAEQRTPERLATPGGNVDYERFIEEIMQPMREGKEVFLRKFNHATFQPGEPVKVDINRVVIVEGSYSCLPILREYYDLKLFVVAEKEERLKRIYKRSGPQKYEMFINKWIPMEELYFSGIDTEKCCDFVVNN